MINKHKRARSPEAGDAALWRAVARAVGRVDEGVAEALVVVLCDGDAAAGAFAEE